MNAEYFLDTNIIAYAFDQSAPAKRTRALELIADRQPWAISWQIIQEFSNVSLHRFRVPLSPGFLDDFNARVLWPHCHTLPGASLCSEALRIHRETQYLYYDSLTVAAALEAGVSILYSEDLQHDRRIGALRIVNPFL